MNTGYKDLAKSTFRNLSLQRKAGIWQILTSPLENKYTNTNICEYKYIQIQIYIDTRYKWEKLSLPGKLEKWQMHKDKQ